MPRVVHFEIGADDPSRALNFYQGVFGWRVSKWEGSEGYWLVNTGDGAPGIDGGVYPRHEGMSLNGYVNVVEVPSLDEYVSRVRIAGGEPVTGRITIPKVGHFAYCRDTEGNTFGLMQADPSA